MTTARRSDTDADRVPTLTGSVTETDTFGFAAMCSSLRLNSVDDVMYTRSPSQSGMSG